MTAHPRSRLPAASSRTLLAVLIAALLTASGVFVLARETPAVVGPGCDSPPVGPSPQSPIRHLFIIIKENHAFENYFGAYPGVVGYPANGSFPTSFGANSTVSPFPLNQSSTPDLPHDHASEVVDEDQGRNDLFVAQAAAMGAPDPSAAVGYYGASQIPQYYAYARSYALGDRFFSGYLGPTAPNRDFDLAATTDGQTTDAEPAVGSLGAPTVLNQLADAGVPWAYDYTGNRGNLTPLEFQDIASRPCEVQAVQPVSNLSAQLAEAAPPSVVFVDPSHDPVGPNGLDGVSEHPPDNVTIGADWTTALVNAIFSSAVGPSSAVLLYFDEAGGFWDPVAPPVVAGSPDGFRVPFLVMSGFTPQGLVVDQTMDPASVIAFIDWNWGLPPLNARVAGSAGLGPFFAFGAAPRPPVLLPTPFNLTSLGNESEGTNDAASTPSAEPAANLDTSPAGFAHAPGPSARVQEMVGLVGGRDPPPIRGIPVERPRGRFIV